jgi:hypothetical protein
MPKAYVYPAFLHHAVTYHMWSIITRVSTEVTFWHSAEYGSDFRCNSGEIPRNSAEFRGISRNFAGIAQKSLQKSKNSAEFRVGGIPWTP